MCNVQQIVTKLASQESRATSGPAPGRAQRRGQRRGLSREGALVTNHIWHWLFKPLGVPAHVSFTWSSATLADIRRRYPSLLVCAITNGRGDVSKIPELAPFFDFSPECLGISYWNGYNLLNIRT